VFDLEIVAAVDVGTVNWHLYSSRGDATPAPLSGRGQPGDHVSVTLMVPPSVDADFEVVALATTQDKFGSEKLRGQGVTPILVHAP
jgi:hypothetical protein